MDNTWNKLYDAAKQVLNPREISKMIEAGGVAAAIESTSGKIYVGVCVDTACTLGICAERNAIFHMITNGEMQSGGLLQSTVQEKRFHPAVPVVNS